MQRPFSSDSH